MNRDYRRKAQGSLWDSGFGSALLSCSISVFLKKNEGIYKTIEGSRPLNLRGQNIGAAAWESTIICCLL